jgi:hypothetical protein
MFGHKAQYAMLTTYKSTWAVHYIYQTGQLQVSSAVHHNDINPSALAVGWYLIRLSIEDHKHKHKLYKRLSDAEPRLVEAWSTAKVQQKDVYHQAGKSKSKSSGQGPSTQTVSLCLQGKMSIHDGVIVWGGSFEGRPAAIKAAPAECGDCINHEVDIMQCLRDLQGREVPELLDYGSFYLDGKLFAYHATELVGKPLLDWHCASKNKKVQARNGLLAIHAHKVSHGDIRAPNIIVSSSNGFPSAHRVYFIDFGQASRNAGADDFASDLEALEHDVFRV